MANNNEFGGGAFFGCLWGIAQLATYVMSFIRWFSTEHYSFWHGFKELIWALCPIVNFTYVWDWWFAFFALVIALVLFAFQTLDALVNGKTV